MDANQYTAGDTGGQEAEQAAYDAAFAQAFGRENNAETAEFLRSTGGRASGRFPWLYEPIRYALRDLVRDFGPEDGAHIFKVGPGFKYHPDNVKPRHQRATWESIVAEIVTTNDPDEVADPDNAIHITAYRRLKAKAERKDKANPESSAGEQPDTYDKNALSELEKLNQRYVAVAEDGKLLIAYIEDDKEQPGKKRFRTLSVRDFENLHSNVTIERDPEAAGLSRNASPTIELGRAWIKWPDRRTAYGWTFDHKAPPASVIGKGYHARLNRWFGWGIEPKPGDWKPIEDLIRNVICDGDESNFQYLIRWLAYRFQRPDRRMGTCVTMKGEEGVGKGVLGNMMVHICGTHGLSLSDPGKIIGKFSSHLQMKIFVFLDEALRPEIPAHESRLKQIITEKTIEFEAKFKDVTDGVNRLGLMQATNSEWAVRASKTARRFFVLKVSSKRRVDRSAEGEFESANDANRTYWKDLNRFIYQEGGAEAFFHAMLHYPLGDFDPMADLVETAELSVDKRRNFAGPDLWLDRALAMGVIPGTAPNDEPAVWKAYQKWRSQDLLILCNRWLETQRVKAVITAKMLGPLLRDAGWRVRKSDGRKVWFCPSLTDARIEFSRKRLAGKNPYGGEDEA